MGNAEYMGGTQPHDAKYFPGDGWSAGTNVTDADNPVVGSLTVDLGSIKTVCSVGQRATLYNESSTLYRLSYSSDGVAYVDYSQDLNGPNRYANVEERIALDEQGSNERGIKARYLRFTPLDWQCWPSMCVEAYVDDTSGTGTSDSPGSNDVYLKIAAIAAGVFIVGVMILACAYVRVKMDARLKYVQMEMDMDMRKELTDAEDKAFIDMKT